jgi:hypothetical protein
MVQLEAGDDKEEGIAILNEGEGTWDHGTDDKKELILSLLHGYMPSRAAPPPTLYHA